MKASRYVYALLRPDTEKAFYIGMGQGMRAWDHVKFRKRGKSHKDNLICKYIDDLGYPEIPVKIFSKGLTHQEACDLEIALIHAIGRHPHGPLTNVVRGGEGLADPSEEFRQKHSLKMKEVLSCPETRAAMSLKAKARDRTGPWEQRRKDAARTPEVRAKQSLARKGKPIGFKGRKDPRTQEGKQLWTEKMIGRNWYTDGTREVRLSEGDLPPPGWQPGRGPFLTSESREKMALAKRGKTLTEEHKRKVGDAHKGQKRAHFDSSWWSSPEGQAHAHKIWITDGLEETRILPSDPIPTGWMRGRIKGKPAPNKGKPMSEEAKRHLSEINKGKTPSEETRRKISLAGKGRVLSAETRDKISQGHLRRSSIV